MMQQDCLLPVDGFAWAKQPWEAFRAGRFTLREAAGFSVCVGLKFLGNWFYFWRTGEAANRSTQSDQMETSSQPLELVYHSLVSGICRLVWGVTQFSSTSSERMRHPFAMLIANNAESIATKLPPHANEACVTSCAAYAASISSGSKHRPSSVFHSTWKPAALLR